MMQGDKNTYVLHYSPDGNTWQQYGLFPAVSGSGLRTRGIAAISPPASNPSFVARYVRVSAYSGDGNYSISELRLYDTSSHLVSAGKPATGPLPAQLTDPGSSVPDGTAWNGKHAVILPDVGSAHAIGIDLGSVKEICGIASGCYSTPVIQADRNVYQLDYSTDGYTWHPYGQFPAIGADGLHTRTMNPPPSNPGFSARYVRVWAVSGNGSYSVSKLTLYGTTLGNIPLTTNAATFGPEPYVTNGDYAFPGGDRNDPRYATALGLCNTPNSIPKVRVELAKRGGKKSGFEFSLDIDGASIPEAPAECGRGGGTVSLLTAFALAGIDAPGVTVSDVASWRCDKGVLSTRSRGRGP